MVLQQWVFNTDSVVSAGDHIKWAVRTHHHVEVWVGL